MHLPSSSQSRQNSSEAPSEAAPRKEQWAIINKYKALEFQRMKNQEYMLDRQKKQQFRRQLDHQMNSKSNAEEREKQQNREYYQQLAEQGEQQRQREEFEKQKRYMNRKNVDVQNVGKGENRSRLKDGDTGYHLDIGIKSQIEHKEKEDKFRRDMMDTLDIQLKQKDVEQRMNKVRNMELEENHKRVQGGLFMPANRRQYGQSQKVYEYYQNVDKERQVREQDLDHKFVDEARKKSIKAEMEREKALEIKKSQEKEMVLDTLGRQVKDIRRKRVEDSSTNPEDVSFKFISGIFQPKYKGYDKQLYKAQLLKQAQQQKQRKHLQNHMNKQQYKLNMNQLSKAVLGGYAQQNYLDRSMGAIGQKYQIDKVDRDLEDEDVEVIKSRIRNIRGRGNMSTII